MRGTSDEPQSANYPGWGARVLRACVWWAEWNAWQIELRYCSGHAFARIGPFVILAGLGQEEAGMEKSELPPILADAEEIDPTSDDEAAFAECDANIATGHFVSFSSDEELESFLDELAARPQAS